MLDPVRVLTVQTKGQKLAKAMSPSTTAKMCHPHSKEYCFGQKLLRKINRKPGNGLDYHLQLPPKPGWNILKRKINRRNKTRKNVNVNKKPSEPKKLLLPNDLY